MKLMIIGKKKSKIKIAIIVVIFIILAVFYGVFSALSWSGVEKTTQNSLKYLEEVKLLLDKDSLSREEIYKLSFETAEFSCEILNLTVWQENIFSNLRDSRQNCEKSIKTAEKLNYSVEKLKNYLKKDEKASKIIEEFSAKINAEKSDFDKMRELWADLAAETSAENPKLSDDAKKISEILGRVSQANKDKNRQNFEKERTEFEKAVAHFVDFRKNNPEIEKMIQEMAEVK